MSSKCPLALTQLFLLTPPQYALGALDSILRHVAAAIVKVIQCLAHVFTAFPVCLHWLLYHAPHSVNVTHLLVICADSCSLTPLHPRSKPLPPAGCPSLVS